MAILQPSEIGGSDAWWEGMEKEWKKGQQVEEWRGRPIQDINAGYPGGAMQFQTDMGEWDERNRTGWFDYYKSARPAYEASKKPPSYTDPITGVTEDVTPEQRILRQGTARGLNLLRTNLRGQGNEYVARLRRNLAQRGALDSGSLGAGITSISQNLSNILSEGTQRAAQGESDAYLNILEREKGRAWQSSEAEKQRSFQRAMAQLNRGYAQEDYRQRQSDEPDWLDYLLGGAGSAIGTGVGYGLTRR